MKRTHATILMVVVGVFVFFAITGLSLGAWFFAYAFDRGTPAPATGSPRMDAVRRRFAEPPVFEIVHEDDVRLQRAPPATPLSRPLARLNVLTWDRDDGDLISVTLPFWLLRMK